MQPASFSLRSLMVSIRSLSLNTFVQKSYIYNLFLVQVILCTERIFYKPNIARSFVKLPSNAHELGKAMENFRHLHFYSLVDRWCFPSERKQLLQLAVFLDLPFLPLLHLSHLSHLSHPFPSVAQTADKNLSLSDCKTENSSESNNISAPCISL